ncbi:MAG: NADH-dependent dehydrogenase [Rubinisphaera sp.]|nr:NADH-dependent dehydrogenase [Rubinisphaera sp.]|tara:strand:- start:30438 stop:31727 length:1290 start_codon:yes stop_codon:yes gene_type:complete
MNTKMNRRDAIKATAAISAGLYLGTQTQSNFANSANEKINIACIGVGGRGFSNVNGCSKENLVAFCDVDENRAGKAYEKFPGVPQFSDFRKMFDEMENEIDAVVVSTPDHTHFHPSMWALLRDKHLYCEKPLAHNVWETRTITDTARERVLATQLGAQRHAKQNMRRVVEEIQAGVIGDVLEVYSWVGSSRGMPSPITSSQPVPDTLDWNLWLGPTTAERGYTDKLCPYEWRFWWDYGTGETGNWGCHILDIPFWALDLKYPTQVEASGPEVDPERTPKSMTTQFEFPANEKRPAVTLHWSQGKPEFAEKKKYDVKGLNTIFVGTKGNLACGFDNRKLFPADQFEDYKAPEKTIPDSPGFYQEWFNAIRGGEPASCNFDYTGPLSETVMLGNVAYRGGGFVWDSQTLKTVGNEQAQQLIREDYRKGWDI